MKFHTLLFVAAGLSAATAARADGYSFREPFAQSSVFNPTATLSVENVNGDVVIHTWDKNEIRVEGEKSARTDEELKQIDLKIDLSASEAAIKVRLPKRQGGWGFGNTIRASVRFDITVPATARLEHIQSVNSTIKLDHLPATVNANTVNGAIVARALGGDARLSTVNGTVTAEFDHVGADQKLTFSTVNGGVRVSLPRDTGAAVDCSVVNGHIDCDLPLQNARKSRGSLSGTIGNGGASLKAKTVNGGIRIGAL